MTGKIRLGCNTCDRTDFDFITKLPADWTNLTEVRCYGESIREVGFDDKSRSPLDWQTHLGTCPECRAEEESYGPQ